jgi:hypothetical protein
VHRHYSGLHALPGDPATYLCRHLVVCSLRPDVPCGSITEALVDVAEVRRHTPFSGPPFLVLTV